MMDIKGDFVLKLQRARRHMEELKAEAVSWGKGDHHSVFDERDPDGGPDSFRVRVIADPIPADPFALLIGDVLHNLRGTLDHLTFALAESHCGRPLQEKVQKRSEFPIFGNEGPKAGAELFRDARESKIGAIHHDAQTMIESLQPYHRGDQYVSHPLWVLHELSNIDKHRLLLVSSVASAYSKVHPDLFRYYRFTGDAINVYGILLEPEAVVLRYSAVPVDPTHHMDVKFDPVLKIVFGGGASVKGKGILETLAEVHDYIVDVISPLAKFL